MGGYEDLPGTVPAADMIYQHVARGLASGWNGTSGSVPADVNAGDMANHTYEVGSGCRLECIRNACHWYDH